jgi:hypothetical protein
MTIKIEASKRLKADWFDELSRDEQKDYTEKHPHSKHAERYDNARDAEPVDNGNEERIKQLEMQIEHLHQDIAELKEEGDDYSRERKQLENLQGELTTLKQ